MPNPKRRHSRTRGRKRRAHGAITPPQLTPCRNCHTPKRPHRVCHNCGTYAGREVVKSEDA